MKRILSTILVLRSELLRRLALVFVLGLMVGLAKVGEAIPMSTAWTYQGRLMDANGPADGIFEFEFKLYDSPADGNQLDSTFSLRGVDVIDGYFTVELDFSSDVYNGDECWLDIGVRPGDSVDPFTTLSPRQMVAPTPYALQTRGIFVDSDGKVGIGTREPSGSLYPDSTTLEIAGNAPSIVLNDTFGTFQDDFEISNGGDKVLFRDATDGLDVLTIGLTGTVEGNVGIGTANPNYKLDVFSIDEYGLRVGNANSWFTFFTGGNSRLGLGDGNGNEAGFIAGGENLSGENTLTIAAGDDAGSKPIYLTLHESGNVGIGGKIIPAEMLHINKPSDSLGLRVSSDTTSYQYMNFGATNGYSIGRASDDKFFINRDEPLGSGVLRALTIQPDGKVGIGTSSPNTKLEVAGDFKVNGYILSEEIEATYSYLGPVIGGLNESSPITIIWDRKIGVYGSADSGYGGYFRTKSNGPGYDKGVHGQANSEQGTGVYGEASASSGINYGVVGKTESSSGYGGYFIGRGYFSDKVGIGTESPAEMLHINKSSGSLGMRVSSDIASYQYMNFGATNGYSIGRTFDDKFFINRDEPLGYGALRILTIQSDGKVGIGTHIPAGKLDVNGSIYQRGIQLHADYVFEPDYELESIDEHSEFMWKHKHLKAIQKRQVDENGMEIIEVGAHRRGIVEELETAHIYIEQLNNRIKTLEEKLAKLEAVLNPAQ